MGLFKKIGNMLGIKSHTVVGKILGTTKSNGGNSPTLTEEIAIVRQIGNEALVRQKNIGIPFDAIVKTQNTNVTATQDKTWLGGLFGDLWDNVKDGVNSGLKNAGQTAIDKVTGKLINSDGTQSAKDSISDYASGIMETSIAKYIKQNWFYILFPIIGLMLFGKILFNGKKPTKRRR